MKKEKKKMRKKKKNGEKTENMVTWEQGELEEIRVHKRKIRGQREIEQGKESDRGGI